MKKRIAAGLIFSLALGLGATSAMADTNQTAIYLDLNKLDTKEPAVIKDGRTLLGIRDYFTAIGAEVKWDDRTRTALVTNGDKTILMNPDTKEIFLNGTPQKIDVAPQIIADRIYVPLRYLSETFGYKVEYTQEGEVGRIQLWTPGKAEAPASFSAALTRITDKTPVVALEDNGSGEYRAWKDRHTGYYITDNTLVEAVGASLKMELRRIDMATGEFQSQAFTMPYRYTMIEDVSKDGDTVAIYNNKAQTPSPFVGLSKPSANQAITTLETTIGNLPLYNSEATVTSQKVSGIQLVNQEKRISGYTIDLTNALRDLNQTGYGVTDRGAVGFFIDNHIIVVDDKQKLVGDLNVNDRINHGAMLTLGNNFYVYGVEGGDAKNVFIARINSDGIIDRIYAPLTRFEKNSSLTIADVLIDGGQIKFLVNDGFGCYVVTYTTESGATDIKELEKGITFDRFIPAGDGYRVFGADSGYFYIYDLSK